MPKLWTPKSFTNWARIHKVADKPEHISIPNNVQLIHDITKYGYTEESKIATRPLSDLTAPTTVSMNTGATNWNNKAHNFLYHMAFYITSGADNDADSRVCFMALIPDQTGGSSTYIPLSEQILIPKTTSIPSYVGWTLPMPFLMQPEWYPAVFWHGALAASTAILYSIHIESEQ